MRPDAIVVGSGPSGVHAARALMDAGKTVTIIDGGYSSPDIVERKVGNFEDVRIRDADQWKLFLGEDLSGIPVDGIEGGHGGGMTSGNRSYVTRGAAEHLPVETTGAFVVQSLAAGGLGAAWGGACAFFDDSTLDAMGVPARSLDGPLENVVRAIGVSGPSARPGVQPALPPDHHATRALAKYTAATDRFRALNVTVSQPHNAVLSTPLGNRCANALNDMDYYSDAGRSVYRPQWTLEELIARGCKYEPGWIVSTFQETSECVRVHARSLVTGDATVLECSTFVLAAGAISSARIAAASAGIAGVSLPFVAKPHGYIACIDIASLGRPGPKRPPPA